MSNSTPQERTLKRNYFILGALISAAVTYGTNQYVNGTSDYVCQKGILFGQITAGSTVYLKTEEECLNKQVEIPLKKEKQR